MTLEDDEINKVATDHVKAEWIKYGVSGSHKQRDEEIYRTEGTLKKAMVILRGQGYRVIRESDSADAVSA